MTRLQVLENPPGFNAFNGIAFFSGLNEDDLKQLLNICSFHYIGDSNYELGTIPKVLYHIASNREKYFLFEYNMLNTSFHIIGTNEQFRSFEAEILDLSQTNYSPDWHGLKSTIEKDLDSNREPPQGWIDIDKQYIFFINQEMAKKMDQFLRIEDIVSIKSSNK